MATHQLRRLTGADVPMILPWRNHPDVRRFMFTQHEISSQEHAEFFARALRDPKLAYYLGLEDGAPIGVVSFRDIDVGQETASWGFYTRPGSPAGTGRRMLQLALDRAFDHDGLAKLSAEAFAFNQASIALHLRLGFSVEGILRGHRKYGGQRVDVVRLAMLASHWTMDHRSWLRNTMETRSHEKDTGASIVFRTAASGGDLPSLVSNVLTACIGRVVSLHLDAQRRSTYVGAIELEFRNVARGGGWDTVDIKILDPGGNSLAAGHAHVFVAKGAP